MPLYETLQLRRGNEADLPVLLDGEPGFCVDSGKLFVGSPFGNIQINGTGGPVPSPLYTVYGTYTSPLLITAGVGIVTSSANRQLRYIQGNGGPAIITANPQIAAGITNGQELVLFGTSDVNTVTLEDGNGISLNGECILKDKSQIYMIWDTLQWVEVSRR